jgi:twinkle protein
MTATPPKEPKVATALPTGQYTALPDRGLSADTCKVYDIQAGKRITGHLYRYYTKEDDTKALYVKRRDCDEKRFSTDDARTATLIKTEHGQRYTREGTIGLFGWQAFKAGGPSITITEGELDAAAVYQMNGKYPAVSVRSSSSAVQDCKDFHEYLDAFDKVVIAFDMDKPGQEAAKKVAELFPGKAHTMRMNHGKDACDYLKAGKTADFKKEWWQSKKVGMDGICFGIEDWEKLSTSKPTAGLSLCWPSVNAATYGVRKGEVWTLGGGTGLGKSEAYKELAYGLVKDHGVKVGMIFLEEGHERTGQCLIGKELGYRYFLEGTEEPVKEAKDEAVSLMASHCAITYKTEATWEAVEAKIKTMVNALGVEYIFLDHVTAIAEGKGADVNATLHMIYEKLNVIAVHLDIAIFCVSHLNQAGNKNYTEGAHVSLRDFYGSGAIMQRSNFIIGFEGDIKGDKIPKDRRKLVILKDRNRGDAAGTTVLLKFHKHLNGDELDGRLLEDDEPTDEETMEDLDTDSQD